MNPKLQKYTAERERNEKRIAALHERNAKLDKMIAEKENLELHGLLRGANMSYQDLTAYIQTRAGDVPAGTPAEVPMERDEEDTAYEAHRAHEETADTQAD